MQTHTDEIEIHRDGALGRISLNRPRAINALSLPMIEAITATLEGWANDPAVGAVLITGNGEKGFCAGGDVRAARQAVLEGAPERADAYFAAEYRMNGLIAAWPKPLVAMTHGVVMGGGIGIAGHCRFRIAVGETRYAMPESAIGFFADVGVNAILARAPLPRALLFLLSGAQVGTADAIALGLADSAIAQADRGALELGIAAAAASADPRAALGLLLAANSIDPGPPALVPAADRLPAGPFADVAAFVDAVTATAGLEPYAQLLAARSPISLTATFHAQLAARKMQQVEAVLDMDKRLARLMIRQPDFAEGVRAVLVDKDNTPRWSPATLAEINAPDILAAVDGLD
jgi:enoyl-CoA hydratase